MNNDAQTAQKWLDKVPTTHQEWLEAGAEADNRQADRRLVSIENWAGQGKAVWCRV